MAQQASSAICRKIFSGIQPTGIPHLGNYFGTIANWVKLSEERKVVHEEAVYHCDEPMFCIADIHAIYSPSTRLSYDLARSTLITTASLLALGIDPKKAILFRQSSVLLHERLRSIFDKIVTRERLSHMIQFKEKSKGQKNVINGLVNYPVLQAADILLYKTDLVPIGDDQKQHIELTRDIAEKFNHVAKSMGMKETFPLPSALLNETPFSRRIMSLRDPNKKMSKSDLDKKSYIEFCDEPEVIVEKCKKALTDSISEVYYDKENRPGVSNLIMLHNLATGDSIESICDLYKGINTSEFKLKLADCLVERFKKPKEEFKRLCSDPKHLISVLESGGSRAESIAKATMDEVNLIIGFGLEPPDLSSVDK